MDVAVALGRDEGGDAFGWKVGENGVGVVADAEPDTPSIGVAIHVALPRTFDLLGAKHGLTDIAAVNLFNGLIA